MPSATPAARVASWVRDYVFLSTPDVTVARAVTVFVNFIFVSLVSRAAGAEIAGDFFALYGGVLIASSLFRAGSDQYLIATLPKLPAAEQSVPIEHMTRLVLTMSFAGIAIGVPALIGASHFGSTGSYSAPHWIAAGLCA